MFQPVGDLPPSIYWRRRFAFLAAVVALLVLVVLTVHVLTSGGGSGATAGGAGTSTSPGPSTSPASSVRTSPSHPAPSTTPQTASSHRPSGTSSGTSSGSGGSSSASASVAPCVASHLDLSASVEKTQYAVGDSPVLAIVIKNPGTVPCVQDLADSQIVLSVYNGASRVWGSHDCKIEPGTDKRTLMAGASVQISIVWSGQSSTPKTCDPRQQVGAGTYTLYASLAGRQGRAAGFTIR